MKQNEPTITITQKEFLELYQASQKLMVLENDGVDNWSYYMEGLQDHLAFTFGNVENKFGGRYSLRDIAEQELKQRLGGQ